MEGSLVRRHKRSTFAEGGAAVGGLIIGLGLAVLIVVNTDSHEPFSERTRDYALAALLCLPGTLSLLAWRDRPALYLAAGMIGGITPMLLGSVVGIAFWLVAGLALVAYGRNAGSFRGRLADPAIALLCLVLALAAFVSMFMHQDPGCESGVNWSSCTSDYVTTAEGLIALSIFVLIPIIGWVLSRPRSDPGDENILGNRPNRERQPPRYEPRSIAKVLIASVTLLALMSMGAAFYAAPILVPALWWASSSSSGWRAAAFAFLAALVMAEVGWLVAYLAIKEQQPWIWIGPALGFSVTIAFFRLTRPRAGLDPGL